MPRVKSGFGYSLQPLADKLGIKSGMRMLIIGAPKNFEKLLGKLPSGVIEAKGLRPPLDYIHAFTTSKAPLTRSFAAYARALASNGALWISWPKASSGVATDLNENVIREIGLAHGLVDVKVCAIDSTWSGLKFVYRLKDR